ncbi:hypothetical protein IHQ68_08475 [Chelatococcus sambhunathii]|uniref:Uncharacterized protein n=1 Tax=Chelatococcus sambhunathii TaxID=363953 RepID=A0ABU1DF22_9HYPH|nr:hypothetical protein [Chelatococcus sambhunathii]MDR4306651.1 hypothetical protein [Chelatococcus sambhunathii]
MAGNIEDVLRNSDGLKSILNEAKIAFFFRKKGWPSEQSKYYVDQDTGKLREIDVFASKHYSPPRLAPSDGSPIININVVCERKSLDNLNIIFHSPPPDLLWRNSLEHFWLGWIEELRDITLQIATDFSISDVRIINRVHDYLTARAYPINSRALCVHVDLTPPPVDIQVTAFREARGAKSFSDDTIEDARVGPLWNAIRANLSAIKAVRTQASIATRSWIHGIDFRLEGPDRFKKLAGFFIDTELLRNVFFHSFVVVDSRLWRVVRERVAEVHSARVFISTVDNETRYVDIVNARFSELYISNMLRHFSRSARKSNSRLKRFIESADWMPGQMEEELARILELPAGRESTNVFTSRLDNDFRKSPSNIGG